MSGIIYLFHTLYCLSVSLCPHLMHSVPGVMELHEVDATLALPLSVSALNHRYSVQSKPLIHAVEKQTDLCKIN